MKKEITIAASSAVALILFFGSVSYLLFPQVTVQGTTASIDVYTQKNGKGANKPSGNFALNETVIIYAEVRNASNMPVGGRYPSFEVDWPINDTTNGLVRNVLILSTNKTDASGIAWIRFRIPPTPNSIGKWLVYSTVDVDGQLVVDTLPFFVQ